MRKLFQGFIAAAVLVTGMAVTAPTPAAAQNLSIEVGPRGVQVNQGRHFCDRNPRARECRGYHRGDRRDHRWDDRRGDRWDRDHRGRPGAGRVSRDSVARCAQRYRSYDPRTHTYVANSRGDRRVCQL